MMRVLALLLDGLVGTVTQGLPHLLGEECSQCMQSITAIATAVAITVVLAVRRRLSKNTLKNEPCECQRQGVILS